ncbi:hypothetical protein COLO4_18936 [Corchorus olitorius]|uniref:CHD subfamily II SANT-like domain-containing protein n=1 Tax=Corchorus olitorius TaxID=93759 RepID=A0A1R3J7B5_9ROSI|nr:hypothetical protein COLO4_18936 [Corchorus olitorius]
MTDSPTFSDGVPKEGLRIQDVLVRIAVLLLLGTKVKSASENPGTRLFTDDIIMRYPTLKGGKFWKEEHDLLLLRAVLKHGYGRWQAIVDDKDLRIQEVICQELNLPFINFPVPGQAGPQVQNGANTINAEATGNQTRGNGSGNDVGGDVPQGVTDTVNQGQGYQDSNILYHFRDMQRRQVEYVKKRVLLLEKGINAEYQKEYYGDMKPDDGTSDEPDIGQKVEDIPNGSTTQIPSKVIDHLPPIEVIVCFGDDQNFPCAALEEISAAAFNDDPDRLKLPQHYNKMCKILEENVHEAVQSSHNLKKNLTPLKEICEDMIRILSPAQTESKSTVAGSSLPPDQKQPAVVTDVEMVDSLRVEPEKPATVEGAAKGSGPAKSGQIDPKCVQQTTGNDVVMEEASNEESSKINKGSKEESGAGVIVLDE